MLRLVSALAALLALPALAAEGARGMTEEQKTLYAVGLAVARELKAFDLSAAELEVVKKGLTDATTGKKPAVDLEAYQPKVQELARSRGAAKQKAGGEKAVASVMSEKGAVKLDSGIVLVPLAEGSGPYPTASDKVKVHYRGTLADGTEFDSSLKRGPPAVFQLSGVIKCWTEGVQKIRVGGKAKLVCPPQLAYGERGAGNAIPPNATLVFEVELLEIVK